MQKQALKIILPLLLFVASAQANTTESARSLPHADSLYTARQYTQAFELYDKIFSEGHYSPAMLLKMAYIQEALGHLGESLYYLNLYYLATDDSQALKKMEEVAAKNNLEGYETDETIKALAWLQEQYVNIAAALSAACVLLLAGMYFLYRREKSPVAPALGLVVFLALLFTHINFNLIPERAIVAKPNAYLMSGPSSGASVIVVIGEGHSLSVSGHQDVWLRVQWKDQEVYVRESVVRRVEL